MNRTSKLVMIGMLSALSVLLMFINPPIFADFLKLDLGDIPALIGTLLFGPLTGIAIEFLKNVIDFFIKGSPTGIPIGHIANFTAGVLFLLPVYFIYQKFHTNKGLIFACVVGTLTMTAFMVFLNYTYFLPAYAKAQGFDPLEMGELFSYMATTIIPFNLLKGAIDSAVLYLLYPRLKGVVKRLPK